MPVRSELLLFVFPQQASPELSCRAGPTWWHHHCLASPAESASQQATTTPSTWGTQTCRPRPGSPTTSISSKWSSTSPNICRRWGVSLQYFITTCRKSAVVQNCKTQSLFYWGRATKVLLRPFVAPNNMEYDYYYKTIMKTLANICSGDIEYICMYILLV